MKRNYDTNEQIEGVTFFKGREVERTPAFDKMTLFVTGVQPVEEIEKHLTYSPHDLPIEHIFFGANMSFNPGVNFPDDTPEWEAWDNMIKYFLDKGLLCSLDIPVKIAEEFLESILVEYNNFIPQISVKLPYIRQWNYNTMIKLDDKDFNATNPGVWCHHLHALTSKETFTDWSKYTEDKVIK